MPEGWGFKLINPGKPDELCVLLCNHCINDTETDELLKADASEGLKQLDLSLDTTCEAHSEHQRNRPD
jgi:hypothetical protein